MVIENSKEYHTGEEEAEASGSPHAALLLLLPYLPLFELLIMSEVCISLRDAVKKDILPWLNIIVDRPLNLRLSDNNLMKVASKANGRLRTLALINCSKITDDGLQRVIDENPLINKLFLPGCTSLTPNGVIKAVQKLSKPNNHRLNCIQINGIYNMNKQHLETLNHYLLTNRKHQQEQVQQKKQPLLYHNYRKSQAYSNRWDEEFGRMIDVEICPKCNEVRMVFDCPREECRTKSSPMCRMCTYCIPRCEACGKCVQPGDLEDTVCSDVMCSDCWIRISKCCFCNKPCCWQHQNLQIGYGGSTEWICSVCHDNMFLTRSDDVE